MSDELTHSPEYLQKLLNEAEAELILVKKDLNQRTTERDILVSEYERAVGIEKTQGWLHASLHIFNAITNSQCEVKVLQTELDSLTTIYCTADRLPTDKDRDAYGMVWGWNGQKQFWLCVDVSYLRQKQSIFTHWKRTGITQEVSK